MKLNATRILVTGAAGGIGRELSKLLSVRGARLCLVDREMTAVAALAETLQLGEADILPLAGDITKTSDREVIIRRMQETLGGIDILINLAGILDFKRFEDTDPGMIQRILAVNVEAPMQLVREVLPQMISQRAGRIVNIGSMFGSIGFPCFAVYSASKFALRGFSQALRRELNGTGVGVTYVSPRAVKTPLNPDVVNLMAARGMMHMDDAQCVAESIAQAIEKDKNEAYLGFPEKLFARINGVFPGLVDQGIAKQVPDILKYADQNL